MITYKVKSGLFLFAFVIAATAYHVYEQDRIESTSFSNNHTVVDLHMEDEAEPVAEERQD